MPSDAFKQALTFLRNGEARLCTNVCKAALINYPEDINLLCLLSRASIALKLFKEAQGFSKRSNTTFSSIIDSQGNLWRSYVGSR